MQVPLFHNLDDLILDNICDRVKPLVFCKDEKVRKSILASYKSSKNNFIIFLITPFSHARR